MCKNLKHTNKSNGNIDDDDSVKRVWSYKQRSIKMTITHKDEIQCRLGEDYYCSVNLHVPQWPTITVISLCCFQVCVQLCRSGAGHS